MAKRKPLTTVHKQRAERLQVLWEKTKQKQKISQQDINTEIGWSKAAFSQYLNGVIPINFAAAVQICEALNVPLTTLLPEETPESIEDQMRFVKNPSNVSMYISAIESLNQDQIRRLLRNSFNLLEPKTRLSLAIEILQGLED